MKLRAERICICLAVLLAGMLAGSAPMQGQETGTPDPQLASIVGTVTDANGDTVALLPFTIA